MIAEDPNARGGAPSVNSLIARLGQRFRIRGLLPWGQNTAYFAADSEVGALAVAALPFECPTASKADLAYYRLARKLSSLSGPGFPSLLRHGVEQGVPFLAFRRPHGRLLSQHLEEGRVPSHVLLRVADTLLDAIGKAHAAGLVHGELGPECIVIDERDENVGVAILGVGFAQTVLDARPRLMRERTSDFAPAQSHHRAPEVLAGGRLTPAADLYSIGAILHHMVSGRPPTGYEMPEAYGDVPALLEVVRRATSPEPSERYESAAAMRTALNWVDVASDRQDVSRQDIPLWMEDSKVGDIPVTDLIRRSTPPPPPVSGLPPLAPSLTGSALARNSSPPPAWAREPIPKPVSRPAAPYLLDSRPASVPPAPGAASPSLPPRMPSLPPPRAPKPTPRAGTTSLPPMPTVPSIAARPTVPPMPSAPSIATRPTERPMPIAPSIEPSIATRPTERPVAAFTAPTTTAGSFEIDVDLSDLESIFETPATRQAPSLATKALVLVLVVAAALASVVLIAQVVWI